MNNPGLLSAALAGVLSFLSPCVLPLIPAYLSFISGSTAAELSAARSRGRVFVRSLAFSAGFTLAFTIMGIVFSGGAMFVGQSAASQYIGIAGGILVILLGLNLIFDFIKFLDIDSRLIGRFTGKKTKGIFGSLALGFAFAAGWSPCLGPILASILIFASREGNIPKAALLLVSYSAGFALPFLATGLFFDKLKPLLKFFTAHGKGVRIASGLVLTAFGLAMAAGSLGSVSALASRAGYALEDFVAGAAAAGRIIGSLFWALIAAAAGLPVMSGTNRKRLGLLRSAFLLAAAVMIILEAAGIVSTLSLIAKWLTFSGI